MEPTSPQLEPGSTASTAPADPLRAHDWPAEDDQHLDAPRATGSADPNVYGPRFAWRARLLWIIGVGIEVLGGLLIVAFTPAPITVSPGPLVWIGFLLLSGVAFAGAWRAMGRGARWPATPSLVLGWTLIVGGIGRSFLAFADGTLLIPLEVPVGIWLLIAADAPRLRLGRPADWRTAGLTILVIALEGTIFLPYLPAGVPILDGLAAPPDALELTLSVQCGTGALLARSPATVDWQWHGTDVFGPRNDRLTLDVSSPSSGVVIWADSFAMGRQLPAVNASETRLVVNMASAGSSGTYAPDVQTTGDGTQTLPYTVTATFSHGGRWAVVRTASCPG